MWGTLALLLGCATPGSTRADRGPTVFAQQPADVSDVRPAPSVGSTATSSTPGLRLRTVERGPGAPLLAWWLDQRRGRLAIDDDPRFRQPVVQLVAGGSGTLAAAEFGLTPGIRYFARINDTYPLTSFRIPAKPWSYAGANYRYARELWNVAGRRWLEGFAGVRWLSDTNAWELDPNWPHGDGHVAQLGYFTEYATVVGVQMAMVCDDHALADELAGFFVRYADRLKTLAQIRRSAPAGASTTLLAKRGPDHARTFEWIQPHGKGRRVRECGLCNSQLFYPATRLLRHISRLPSSQRTETMLVFATTYGPLLVDEHLYRNLYEVSWRYWDAKHLPPHLVDIWRTFIEAEIQPKYRFHHAMVDRDLWLLASVAEVLGAHANDPILVPLAQDRKSKFIEAMRVGLELLAQKRTPLAPLVDDQGLSRPTATYFVDDFSDHRDFAAAGNTEAVFPPLDRRQPRAGTSWDVAHVSRLPIALRALIDNRHATGMDFPSLDQAREVARHWAGRVFNGDHQRPLWANFFDGHDGWYRVGYHGDAFGYPPSVHCDQRVEGKPCLMFGAIQGWGFLAFSEPSLARVLDDLVQLAADQQANSFRARYYSYRGQSFRFHNDDGTPNYPAMLLWVLGAAPERLPGCLADRG